MTPQITFIIYHKYLKHGIVKERLQKRDYSSDVAIVFCDVDITDGH